MHRDTKLLTDVCIASPVICNLPNYTNYVPAVALTAWILVSLHGVLLCTMYKTTSIMFSIIYTFNQFSSKQKSRKSATKGNIDICGCYKEWGNVDREFASCSSHVMT